MKQYKTFMEAVNELPKGIRSLYLTQVIGSGIIGVGEYLKEKKEHPEYFGEKGEILLTPKATTN